MKNVLKLLAKSVLITSGLTATASATDAAIQQKVFGSGMTILEISNEEMDGVMKIIKSLEKSGSLIKDNNEVIENEAKDKKDTFLCVLLGILGACVLEKLLAGKEVKYKIPGKGLMRAGEGTISAGERAIVTSRGWATIKAGQDFQYCLILVEVEVQLKLVRIFNAALSCNYFWNRKILLKWA